MELGRCARQSQRKAWMTSPGVCSPNSSESTDASGEPIRKSTVATFSFGEACCCCCCRCCCCCCFGGSGGFAADDEAGAEAEAEAALLLLPPPLPTPCLLAGRGALSPLALPVSPLESSPPESDDAGAVEDPEPDEEPDEEPNALLPDLRFFGDR
jgi:hypothetical protein